MSIQIKFDLPKGGISQKTASRDAISNASTDFVQSMRLV